MTNRESLHYTKEHEWLSIDGDVATVGITDYAAEKLGDIVFVDLPKLGSSTTYMKICGEIVAVNDSVTATPELVNQDPMGAGWLIKIKFTELPALLTHEEYAQLTNEG